MTRSKGTQKTWPDETPEQIIERVRREHGDAVARIVAASFEGPGADRRGQRTAFLFSVGDKRSRRFGVLPYRGKSSQWKA